MNDKLTFTGGEPSMSEDDFLRIQQSNRLGMHGLAKAFSDDPFIVSGCEVTPNASNIDVAAGYIFFGGELIQVDAQVNVVDTEGNGFYRYEIETTFEAGGDKTYLDSTPRQTWQKKRGIAVSVTAISGGDLDVNLGPRFTELVQDIIDVNNNGVITETVEFTGWNMDTDFSEDVPYTLPAGRKISSIVAVLDNPSTARSIVNLAGINPTSGLAQGGVNIYNDTTNIIQLLRLTGGDFDNATYNDTDGRITIQHIPE